MKGVLKNIILLAMVLVASYFSASCFGKWYDHFAPGELDGSVIGSDSSLQFIAGLPFAYIFFLILGFKIFGEGNKKKWIGWLLVPPTLFFASGDLKHFYVPVALGVIAWVLARVIQRIVVKIKMG